MSPLPSDLERVRVSVKTRTVREAFDDLCRDLTGRPLAVNDRGEMLASEGRSLARLFEHVLEQYFDEHVPLMATYFPYSGVVVVTDLDGRSVTNVVERLEKRRAEGGS